MKLLALFDVALPFSTFSRSCPWWVFAKRCFVQGQKKLGTKFTFIEQAQPAWQSMDCTVSWHRRHFWGRLQVQVLWTKRFYFPNPSKFTLFEQMWRIHDTSWYYIWLHCMRLQFFFETRCLFIFIVKKRLFVSSSLIQEIKAAEVQPGWTFPPAFGDEKGFGVEPSNVRSSEAAGMAGNSPVDLKHLNPHDSDYNIKIYQNTGFHQTPAWIYFEHPGARVHSRTIWILAIGHALLDMLMPPGSLYGDVEQLLALSTACCPWSEIRHPDELLKIYFNSWEVV